MIERKIKTFLPTEYGDYVVYGYLAQDGKEHIALVKGDVLSIDSEASRKEIPWCRVHSECLTGEVFGSLKCDCKEQLELAFQKIEERGSGIILYLRQEGRGIGLIEKLKAYELQYQGRDTVEANLELGHEADLRDYGIAAEMLKDLGVSAICMMTNNPDKVAQLESYGITITERVSVEPSRVGEYNREYLRTKMKKMRHIFQSISLSL